MPMGRVSSGYRKRCGYRWRVHCRLHVSRGEKVVGTEGGIVVGTEGGRVACTEGGKGGSTEEWQVQMEGKLLVQREESGGYRGREFSVDGPVYSSLFSIYFPVTEERRGSM